MSGFEIKVKNLSEDIDKKKLTEMFEEYGKVTRCVRLDWGAFVTMENSEDGKRAPPVGQVLLLDGLGCFGK